MKIRKATLIATVILVAGCAKRDKDSPRLAWRAETMGPGGSDTHCSFSKPIVTREPDGKYSIIVTDRDGGEFHATGFDSVSVSPVKDDDSDLCGLANGNKPKAP
jgi:hypothetical protein